MKKLPLLSLAILFAAYSTFGWFLTHLLPFSGCFPQEQVHRLQDLFQCLTQSTVIWLWGFVLIFTLLQALLLTTWFNGLKIFVNRWLKSDVGYFTLILVTSLGITMALVWLKTLGYFLVLLAAEILARLDLQNAGFNRWQSLIVLTSFSLAGLAVGWLASFNPMFGPI